MLEGLASVDWGNLTHAYASAGDVPYLLRAIAFGDPMPESYWTDDPFEALGLTICHQGTIYESTAYAVPFLIEIIASDDNDATSRFTTNGNSGDLLRLLASFSEGTGYYTPHETLLSSRGRYSSEDVAARIALEHSWCEAIQAAVIKGIPVYLQRLTDFRPDVQRSARDLLTTLKNVHVGQATHTVGREVNHPRLYRYSSSGKIPWHQDDTLRPNVDNVNVERSQLLSGLDSIDWSRLQHAFGSAEDMPYLLRTIAFGDPFNDPLPREYWTDNPFVALSLTTCYQGTIYEATSHVVPFLIELVNDKSVMAGSYRAYLLHLLSRIVQGSGFFSAACAPGQNGNTPLLRAEEFQQEIAAESSWCEAIWNAVMEGVPVYLAYQGDADESVGLAVELLLDACHKAAISSPSANDVTR